MFLILLAALLAQGPPPLELSGTVKSEPYDFEIGLPKGWEASRSTGATFFRVVAPKDGLADGAAWLAHHDSNHPVTLPFLSDVFLKRAAKEYPGFKNVSERHVQAGGFPAHQIVFSATAKGGKELIFVHTVIQRQLQEYFILDVVAAAAEKDRVIELSDKMLGSFRSGLGVPREREDRVARTTAMLKSATLRAPGTVWHELIVGDKKLGWQKYTLREAKVGGAAGWEFESEVRQEDADGGTRSDVSKGAFTLDGAIQRVEVSRSVRTAKDPPVDVKETASLIKGAYKAERRFLDQKTEKEMKLPEGVYLGDVAEAIRRVLALAPAGKHAFRILEPFRDLPVIEEWVNGGPGRMKVDGKEIDVIQALVTTGRLEAAEHLYDPDGGLIRRKTAGGFMVLKRSTEEEALK